LLAVSKYKQKPLVNYSAIFTPNITKNGLYHRKLSQKNKRVPNFLKHSVHRNNLKHKIQKDVNEKRKKQQTHGCGTYLQDSFN